MMSQGSATAHQLYVVLLNHHENRSYFALAENGTILQKHDDKFPGDP